MAEKNGKSYIRPSVIAVAVLAVVFSHFAVSQFITFETEKDSVITEAINIPPVKIKTESEVKEPGIAITARRDEEISPVPKRENGGFAPKQAVVRQVVRQKETRKKESDRESRAERLRRAEKLLTGV